ncbi:MAG: VOC family protein [Robiginitomaculum sp.]|nr:VOC family protein [Robiginitomaculum sp.]
MNSLHNLRLNQVTLGASDMAASVAFYEMLGLTLIVNSAPRYVRFEFPESQHGERATLSLHEVAPGWAPGDGPLIYFEMDDLDAYLADIKVKPITPPKTQTYLWREADILDPAGNKIRLYQAGENRRFPPWRVA